MRPGALIRTAALLVLFFFNSSLAQTLEKTPEQKSAKWLRGSGKDLQICIKGEVVDAEGKPAPDFQITATVGTDYVKSATEVAKEGNRFKVWIPVNQHNWFNVQISASSKKSGHVAYQVLTPPKLRQAAIDGIKLTLQVPTKEVKVKVVENNQPVRNAIAEAECDGTPFRTRTDSNGIARFKLLPDQKLSYLSAWTDDFRIGGYSFFRKPTRDLNATEYVVQMYKCHDIKIRFVDENKSPVAGVGFKFEFSTGEPDYNYIAGNENSHMKTDSAGEAVFRYLPDWTNPHFYVELDKRDWIFDGELEKDRDHVTYRLKRAKSRKQGTGRVASNLTSSGGFFIKVESFQAEQEHRIDQLFAFTNSDGTFNVEVLPDATYCALVDDTRWVGNMIDLVPYNSAIDTLNPITLSVFEGQEVAIIGTSGQKRNPWANARVSLRRNHHFKWIENGEEKSGVGSQDFSVTTDEFGKATVRTLPGELEASIDTPHWRVKNKVAVVQGKPTEITLHRELEEKKNVKGQVVLASGESMNFEGTEIHAGAIDGKYDDQQTVKCTADGSFSFDIFATKIGIFARTPDGLITGSSKVNSLNVQLELQMYPTKNFEGKLLDEGNRPLADKTIHATIRIEGSRNFSANAPTSFDVQHIETKTDEQGNFTLKGLCTKTKVELAVVDASTFPDYGRRSLGEVSLEPGDSRPRTEFKLNLKGR